MMNEEMITIQKSRHCGFNPQSLVALNHDSLKMNKIFKIKNLENLKNRNKIRIQAIFLLLFFVLFLSIGYGNNKAYYENLLRKAEKEENRQNYAKTMEDLMQVKLYAKDNKLDSMQAHALHKMGIVYTDMLSYEKAIECYLEAYQIALKLPDKKYEIGHLNNIGQLYSLCNNMDKAEEYIEKAYKLAVSKNDNFAMIQLLGNLIIVSNRKGNFEQAEKRFQIAMERIKQFPTTPHNIYIKGIRAEQLYLKKEYDSAEQLALEVLNQNKGLYPELDADCLFLLSNIYHKKQYYSKAIFYAKEALNGSVCVPMIVEIYAHLSTIYRSANFPSLAWQYQDSLIRMKDSLLQLNNTSQLLRGQIQFDWNNMEKKMMESKAKQRQERLIFTLSLVFLVILAILFVWILRIRLTKNKQLKIIAELELKKEKL